MTHARNARMNITRTTVASLKEELRSRKLAVSGKKSDLVSRLQRHTLMCGAALKLQSIVRGWLAREWIRSKGPALLKRSICINKCDFYTMATPGDIPLRQFISYRDTLENVYAFDILSFMNIRLSAGGVVRNPYTNLTIPPQVRIIARRMVNLGRCIGSGPNTSIEYNAPSEEQKVIDFFQELTRLSFTLNHSWISGMSDTRLHRFCRYLHGAWEAGFFNTSMKVRICPPNGQLFTQEEPEFGSRTDRAASLSYILEAGRRLTSSSANDEDRKMGATLFLCVLTRLSPSARQSLPWIYDISWPAETGVHVV